MVPLTLQYNHKFLVNTKLISSTFIILGHISNQKKQPSMINGNTNIENLRVGN